MKQTKNFLLLLKWQIIQSQLFDYLIIQFTSSWKTFLFFFLCSDKVANLIVFWTCWARFGAWHKLEGPRFKSLHYRSKRFWGVSWTKSRIVWSKTKPPLLYIERERERERMRLKVILAKSKMKNLILIIHLISHNHFLYTMYHLHLLETTFHLQKPHFSTHKSIKLDIVTAQQWNNDIPSAHQTQTLEAHKKLHFISNKTFFNLFMVSQSAKS